jgi:hypothetical protein
LVLHILNDVFVCGVFLLLGIQHAALTHPGAYGYNEQGCRKSKYHEDSKRNRKCANTAMANEMQIGT